MNKIIILFVALILSSNIVILSNNKSVTTVKNTSTKIRPRSLTGQPFYCAYQDGYVYITFCRNIGQAEVTVTDMVSGECFTITGNTSSYEWLIPVSDSESSYLIEVTTTSGYYYSTILSY